MSVHVGVTAVRRISAGQFKLKRESAECQVNLVFRFRRRSSPHKKQQHFNDRFRRSYGDDKSGGQFDARDT
jgi:hypothetical protein